MSQDRTIAIEFTREDLVAIREAVGRKNGSQGIVSVREVETFIRDLAIDRARGITATQHYFDEEDLASMVFQVGGAAIGVAMQDHPHYIMPSERVSDAILGIMKDLGHDISGVPGYQPNRATSILRSATTEVST